MIAAARGSGTRVGSCCVCVCVCVVRVVWCGVVLWGWCRRRDVVVWWCSIVCVLGVVVWCCSVGGVALGCMAREHMRFLTACICIYMYLCGLYYVSVALVTMGRAFVTCGGLVSTAAPKGASMSALGAAHVSMLRASASLDGVAPTAARVSSAFFFPFFLFCGTIIIIMYIYNVNDSKGEQCLFFSFFFVLWDDYYYYVYL